MKRYFTPSMRKISLAVAMGLGCCLPMAAAVALGNPTPAAPGADAVAQFSDSASQAPVYYTVRQAREAGVLEAAAPQPATPAARVAPERAVARPTLAYGVTFDHGLVSFPVGNLSARNLTTVYSAPKNNVMSGARSKSGNYWFATFTYNQNGTINYHASALVRYNWAAKHIDRSITLKDAPEVVTDMTYDPATRTLWGIEATTGKATTNLCRFDTVSGQVTRVATFNDRIYGIASDHAGQLFMISRSGSFYRYNSATRQLVLISNTGLEAKYVSTMDFDDNGRQAYYACCQTGGTTILAQISAATGAATRAGYIGNISTSYELSALSVRQTTPAAEAPAPATGLTLKPGARGALTATVSWTNPTTTVGGTKLDSISEVRLYLNDALHSTLKGTPGQAMSTTLTGLKTGNNGVSIIVVNAAGESLPAGATSWVGQDVPVAPTNLKVVRDGGKNATISWTAPTKGLHDGYLRTSNLKYRIIRYGEWAPTTDTLLCQRTYRSTTYQDTHVDSLGLYYYTVQALTSSYGGTAMSDSVILGPALVPPYGTAFYSDYEWGQWTTWDNNHDNRTWSSIAGIRYASHLAMGVKSDDWLISPPIKLSKDSTYYIYFLGYTGAGQYYVKRLDVTLGKSSDWQSQTTKLGQMYIADRAVHQGRYTATVTEDGEYYFGLHDVSDYCLAALKVTNFIVIVKHTGFVKGQITDPDGHPLAGVAVGIDHSNIADTTDATGHYVLDYLPTGNYGLTATKLGYADYHSLADSVHVQNDSTTLRNLVLTPLQQLSLKGTIHDTEGTPVVAATVTLSGYGQEQTIKTDAQGAFSISPIYAHDDYCLRVLKYKYVKVADSLAIASDTTLSIILQPKVLPPYRLTASSDTAAHAVNLSWEAPRETFRHDNGFFTAQTGRRAGTEYTVNGTVFREPALLKSISWVTTSYQGPHNQMNLWIFDIDSTGAPTKHVLFNVMDVPQVDERWNTYELPSPVEAPNGYLLGISYTHGMSSLAHDSGADPEYPYPLRTTWDVGDWRTDKWRCVDESYLPDNNLIRATGDELGTTVQQFRYKYRLWRLTEDQVFNPEKWTLVIDTTSALTGVDNLSSVAKGTYYYAVQVVYPDTLSDFAFSQAVEVDGGPSGVTDVKLAQLDVWPVPASTVLNLSVEADAACLYDLSGRLAVSASGASQLDVSALAPGVYLLKVTVGGHSVLRKVIVRH